MNSLSLHCFKSPNFHLSKKLFIFLSPPQKRHFVLKSRISIYSEFDIGVPQLVSLTCRKKDKRNIYTTKLSAGLRTGSRWENPSFWSSFSLYHRLFAQVELELQTPILCLWWARLKIASGGCNITPDLSRLWERKLRSHHSASVISLSPQHTTAESKPTPSVNVGMQRTDCWQAEPQVGSWKQPCLAVELVSSWSKSQMWLCSVSSVRQMTILWTSLKSFLLNQFCFQLDLGFSSSLVLTLFSYSQVPALWNTLRWALLDRKLTSSCSGGPNS